MRLMCQVGEQKDRRDYRHGECGGGGALDNSGGRVTVFNNVLKVLVQLGWDSVKKPVDPNQRYLTFS